MNERSISVSKKHWNFLWMLVSLTYLIRNGISCDRIFDIDFEENTFRLDGRPFQYVSGSVHYFRSPHQYWRDRLRTLRAAGLNAVSTYVEWSFHEPERGTYIWDGDKDLEKFIRIAQEEDLYVILRPGPYICAERDMGGFPYWLLSYYPSIKLRTNDEEYKNEVQIWYTHLMSKMKPLLYGNGGPIILVQVENEYGSFPACDAVYMSWLANLTRSWVEDAAVLFTTDGTSSNMLRCGSTPGVYATVDFGAEQDVSAAFAAMRQVSKRGPLVNSEFYPGWLTHWSESPARTSAAEVVKTLMQMLSRNANVNFYMFHGGTNFEYTAGANLGVKYLPDLTSYDYDAPMTEAGDITPKYTLIRNALLDFNMSMPSHPPPLKKLKGSLGPVVLRPLVSLLSPQGRTTLGRAPSRWHRPPTFERLHQYSGHVLYETRLPQETSKDLKVTRLCDRALVFKDGNFIGDLSRTRKKYSLKISPGEGSLLQILVENQGRINYGAVVNDFKGILGNVTLGSTVLTGWNVTGFPLDVLSGGLAGMPQWDDAETPTTEDLKKGPVLYGGTFVWQETMTKDTYLDMTGWEKGVAWINGKNLGRYWPAEGPQVTLYTPGVYLNPYPRENIIFLLELQRAPSNLSVNFIDYPIGI